MVLESGVELRTPVALYVGMLPTRLSAPTSRSTFGRQHFYIFIFFLIKANFFYYLFFTNCVPPPIFDKTEYIFSKSQKKQKGDIQGPVVPYCCHAVWMDLIRACII